MFIFVLFLLAFGERVFFDLGPNIELVTIALGLAATYLNKKNSLVLSLFIVMLSDLIIGNSMIFLFTWTGFLIPAIILLHDRRCFPAL